MELRALAVIASLFFALPAVADSTNGTAQFCWAEGALDNTVYYAEALERADRSASFAELIEISGIDYKSISCVRSAIASHTSKKLRLLKAWRHVELEVVDTTFMSDLDY